MPIVLTIIGVTLSAIGLVTVVSGAVLTARAYSRLGTVKASIDAVEVLKEEVASVRRTLGDATLEIASVRSSLGDAHANATRLVSVIRGLVDLLDRHGIPVPPLPILEGTHSP